MPLITSQIFLFLLVSSSTINIDNLLLPAPYYTIYLYQIMAEPEPDSPLPPTQSLLPDNYALRKLPLDFLLNAGEAISCISTHKSNLYIGTTKGQLLHYYIFDDAEEYILILSLQIPGCENHPVKKLLVVPDAEMCLVLCNRVIYPYTLPELSPCHIGKIKDVNDVSRLSQVKNPKVKNKHDKIIVYTSNKIRVVQLLPDTVKLLRDINYAGAVEGFSSAAGTLANYSNICLVANDKNYDVVDLQQTRRISLFEYNPENVANIAPHIVPFMPMDTGKPSEEYMLTICSVAANSMAMFMNSLGDVTRGTLIWLDEGYPTGGVAVQWPYVIGLFNLAENGIKLTFSSLTTLLVVHTIDFREFSEKAMGLTDVNNFNLVRVEEGVTLADSELLDLLAPVRCDGSLILGHKKQFLKLNVIFCNENSLHCLYTNNEHVAEVKKVINALTNNDIASLESSLLTFQSWGQENGDSFAYRARIVLLLVLGNFEELKKIISNADFPSMNFDLRILLLFDPAFPDKDPLWKEFTLESSLREMIVQSPVKNLDPEFKSWLLHEAYTVTDNRNSSIWQYFRTLLYEDSKSTTDKIQLVDSERSLWQDQNEANEKLFAQLKKNNEYLVLFKIYQLRQEVDPDFNALQVIELGLAILSGSNPIPEGYKLEAGTLTVGSETMDLVLLVFFQLRNHISNSDQYTKKLLELLKIHPDKGLELLQSNKGGQHKSTHRFILKELATTHNIDTKFSSLKLEYLEQSFLEQLEDGKIDIETLDELFIEMEQYLESNIDSYEVALENIKILHSTFQIEVSLADLNWPKLSWIEFLHLHGRKDDSKELVDLYLKFYELLVVKSLKSKPIKPFHIKHDAFTYLSRCFTESSISGLISYLLEKGEYSVAEWMSLYGKMPLPRQTIYFEGYKMQLMEMYQLRASTDIEASINQLMKFYLEIEDQRAKNNSIRHLVSRFGRKYYNVCDLLAILPNDFPVVHIQEYLVSVVLDMDAQRTDTVMKKTLARLDAKFTEKVRKEFEEIHVAEKSSN
ncbi:CIC11C00000005438 [Sungouiella intermedia]|uniref:CIC11C00000005438 n=1 Tax=Sungouiella intermedia TaxID=45354 RepID=A0A1L0D9V6_9ASCO|nr:CIC11C00000005438 [[Candida] intermedia]